MTTYAVQRNNQLVAIEANTPTYAARTILPNGSRLVTRSIGNGGGVFTYDLLAGGLTTVRVSEWEEDLADDGSLGGLPESALVQQLVALRAQQAQAEGVAQAYGNLTAHAVTDNRREQLSLRGVGEGESQILLRDCDS